MEVNAEKDKIMTNGMNNISADISTNGQKLEEVTTFKYLVATWMAPAQPSTYTFYVRNISSTSKTSTMSSSTSRRPSTGFGMQLCGQP